MYFPYSIFLFLFTSFHPWKEWAWKKKRSQILNCMASSSSFSSSSLISTDSLGALSFLKRFSPGRPLTQFPSFNSWCIQFCACSHENSFRKTILLFASSMMRVWGVQWTIHTPHTALCVMACLYLPASLQGPSGQEPCLLFLSGMPDDCHDDDDEETKNKMKIWG